MEKKYGGKMKKLEEKELSMIVGGGTKVWFFLGGLGVLLSGLFAGIFNPLKCNN